MDHSNRKPHLRRQNLETAEPNSTEQFLPRSMTILDYFLLSGVHHMEMSIIESVLLQLKSSAYTRTFDLRGSEAGKRNTAHLFAFLPPQSHLEPRY